MNRLFPAALLLAVWSAPALAQTAPDQANDDIVRVRYVCAGGETMEVVFLNTAGGNSYAVVLDGGELRPMQIAISASGARYTALSPEDGHELWTKGDEATLHDGTGGTARLVRTDCTAVD